MMNEIAFNFLILYSTLLIYSTIHFKKHLNKHLNCNKIVTRISILVSGIIVSLIQYKYNIDTTSINILIVILLFVLHMIQKDNMYA